MFHLGALIAIPYSYHNPYDVVQTNVLGTAHVLDACRASSTLERAGPDLDVRGLRHRPDRAHRRDGTRFRVNRRMPRPRSGPMPWARAISARSGCRSRSCGRSTRSARGSRPGRSSRRSSARPWLGQRQARPARPSSRPDLCQGYRRRLRRDRRLRCRAGPGRQYRPRRRYLDRRPGRADRPPAGPIDRGRDRSRTRTGPPPARSSACSPARPWRRASGDGSRSTRSRRASTRRSPGCATTSTGSGSTTYTT